MNPNCSILDTQFRKVSERVLDFTTHLADIKQLLKDPSVSFSVVWSLDVINEIPQIELAFRVNRRLVYRPFTNSIAVTNAKNEVVHGPTLLAHTDWDEVKRVMFTILDEKKAPQQALPPFQQKSPCSPPRSPPQLQQKTPSPVIGSPLVKSDLRFLSQKRLEEKKKEKAQSPPRLRAPHSPPPVKTPPSPQPMCSLLEDDEVEKSQLKRSRVEIDLCDDDDDHDQVMFTTLVPETPSPSPSFVPESPRSCPSPTLNLI